MLAKIEAGKLELQHQRIKIEQLYRDGGSNSTQTGTDQSVVQCREI